VRRTILFVISVFIIVFFVAAIAGIVRFFASGNNEKTKVNLPDVRNIAYVIEGQEFKLSSGRFEHGTLPGSRTESLVVIVGEPAYGDIDNDGDTDAAVWIANSPGGSGVFFYGAVVVNSGNGISKSTNTILLGDRISPQSIEIGNMIASYVYADRKPGSPMTDEPSVSKSVHVTYDGNSGSIIVK
jgi:hypothetical protein